jgi:hypothetical protein
MLLGQALLESGGEDARDLLQKALAQFTACRANSWISNARLLLAQAELAAGIGFSDMAQGFARRV